MSKGAWQRLALGMFLVIVLMSNTQMQLSASSVAQADSSAKQMSRGDCTFLSNPKIFRDPKEHAQELSRLTERTSSKLPSDNTVAAASQNLPKRNFIDDEIFDKLSQAGIAPASISKDEEFLRRVTLDITGRIPTSDQVKQFLNDKTPDKRDKVISSLVGSPEYVDRWTMFYGDLLKNTAFASNVNRYYQGRNAFYFTIKQALQQNTPYNQFAASLISSTGNTFNNGATDYIVGSFTPMGPVQDTFDAAVVQTSTRFLGIEAFDCLLCHDGAGHLNALNVWGTNTKRAQAWEMSAFFSRLGANRNVVSRDPSIINFDIFDTDSGQYMLNTTTGNRTARQPINGQTSITPRYIFTNERPAANETYRKALGRMLTGDRQFARAAVNYIWEHFFGLGIVDPSSNFDLMRLDPKNPPPQPFTIQPSNPALLEKLTDDFIAHNYDIQALIRTITQSTTYQLSSRYKGEWKEEYTTFFARKLTRRLDAEELHDALITATGILGNYSVEGLAPIQYAMQLPDTNEPLNRQDTTNPQENTLARTFLNTFERGNRDQTPRSNTPSITQGLTLMNSSFVNTRINAGNAATALAKLLVANTDDNQFVDELFLTVLSRRPNKIEKAQALAMLKPQRNAGAEDLMWVLLNKVDFVYNY